MNNKKIAVLNFKRYELMTKVTKHNISANVNQKAIAKPKPNILEETEIQIADEVQSDEIILEEGGSNIWTTTGYQGGGKSKKEGPAQGVDNVIISQAEKKRELNIFGGFDLKRKPRDIKPTEGEIRFYAKHKQILLSCIIEL